MSPEKANNHLEEASGTLGSQLVAMSAWLLQACLFALAMTFRYSGEPGGQLMEYMLASGPVDWRPPILDWLGWPLVIAGLVIARYEYLRRASNNAAFAEPGRIGSLLCLSAFALSDGSVPTTIATLVSIWLCSIVSASREPGTASSLHVSAAAIILFAVCLLSAYMHVQHGFTTIEFFLILISAIFGAASTGMPPAKSVLNQLFMPLWFSLLLALTWTNSISLPSTRLLVMFELSAAFIAVRHFLLQRASLPLPADMQAEE